MKMGKTCYLKTALLEKCTTLCFTVKFGIRYFFHETYHYSIFYQLTHTVQKYKAHIGSHNKNTSSIIMLHTLPISHLEMAIGQHSQYHTAKEHKKKNIRTSWQNIQINISHFISLNISIQVFKTCHIKCIRSS